MSDINTSRRLHFYGAVPGAMRDALAQAFFDADVPARYCLRHGRFEVVDGFADRATLVTKVFRLAYEAAKGE